MICHLEPEVRPPGRARRRLLASVVLALGVVSAAGTARAEVGLGLFVGQPAGLELKLDLQRRTALDLLLGVTSLRDGRADYAHVTYLVTPVVGRGRSVLVPLRLGLGVAFFDGGGGFADQVNVAVRAPLQLGLRLRSTPLEFYGEISFKVVLVNESDTATTDIDGGAGFRLLF
jgi:hypothetical protein